MITQYLSLILSIIFLISTLILMFSRTKGKVFYFSFSVSFLLEIIYYSLLFFRIIPDGRIDLSALLRVSQTIIFGSWFLFEVIEDFLIKYWEKRLIKKIRKLESLNKTLKNTIENLEKENNE